jgi:hypothetical protein
MTAPDKPVCPMSGRVETLPDDDGLPSALIAFGWSSYERAELSVGIATCPKSESSLDSKRNREGQRLGNAGLSRTVVSSDQSRQKKHAPSPMDPSEERTT